MSINSEEPIHSLIYLVTVASVSHDMLCVYKALGLTLVRENYA
jgi:hypothetical protein